MTTKPYWLVQICIDGWAVHYLYRAKKFGRQFVFTPHEDEARRYAKTTALRRARECGGIAVMRGGE